MNQGFFDDISGPTRPSIKQQMDREGMFHEVVVMSDTDNIPAINTKPSADYQYDDVDPNNRLEEHERGDNHYVIVAKSDGSRAGGFRLWLYLKRYMFSFLFIFVFSALLQIVFFIFTSSSKKTLLNVLSLFGIKLNYFGLMNSALLTLTIIPMLFGYMPSLVVTLITLPIITLCTFLLYLAAGKFHPTMMILGFYIQIVITILCSFIAHQLNLNISRFFRMLVKRHMQKKKRAEKILESSYNRETDQSSATLPQYQNDSTLANGDLYNVPTSLDLNNTTTDYMNTSNTINDTSVTAMNDSNIPIDEMNKNGMQEGVTQNRSRSNSTSSSTSSQHEENKKQSDEKNSAANDEPDENKPTESVKEEGTDEKISKQMDSKEREEMVRHFQNASPEPLNTTLGPRAYMSPVSPFGSQTNLQSMECMTEEDIKTSSDITRIPDNQSGTMSKRNSGTLASTAPTEKEKTEEEKTLEELMQIEKKLYKKNRKWYNRILICFAILLMFTQLVMNVAWALSIAAVPLPVVYVVFLPLYPIVNWLFRRLIKGFLYHRIPDKLFIDFVAFSFACYPSKLMIVLLNDWYMFSFYQVYDVVYKVIVYFLFLSRPLYKAYDYCNLVCRECLMCLYSYVPITKKPPMKKMKDYSFKERYEMYVRGQSRKYYVVSLLDVHSTLFLFIFYLVFGFGLIGENEKKSVTLTHIYFFLIHLGISVLMFLPIPIVVQKISFSKFNPFSMGQTYIHANIFKWFLVICVASLGSILAMQRHSIVNIRNLTSVKNAANTTTSAMIADIFTQNLDQITDLMGFN